MGGGACIIIIVVVIIMMERGFLGLRYLLAVSRAKNEGIPRWEMGGEVGRSVGVVVEKG